MIVTIDGPAGAGKSSAAKSLAKRLAFEFLDTGAMYRAVALAALRRKCDIGDGNAVGELARKIDIQLNEGSVFLDAEDVSEAIRRPEVTEAAGALAVHPKVREQLVVLQRRFAESRNIVTEGRDQGSVVFPHAECKFYLVADESERAKRRHRELAANDDKVTLNDVQRAIQERDRRDVQRAVAPLKPADDAVIIDSTNRTLEEVVDMMEHQVQMKRNQQQ